MIAVDTSALMAIILDESEADACIEALHTEDQVLMSAGTLAEAMIVAERRNVAEVLSTLMDRFGFEIVSVTRDSARRSFLAYRKFGKGIHPAGLNFGDCFSYEVAKAHGCRLLYVGGDFSKTDIQGVL